MSSRYIFQKHRLFSRSEMTPLAPELGTAIHQSVNNAYYGLLSEFAIPFGRSFFVPPLNL